MDSIQGPHNPYDGLSISADMREARLPLSTFGPVPELRAGLHPAQVPPHHQPPPGRAVTPTATWPAMWPHLSEGLRDPSRSTPGGDASIAQAGPAEAP